ncbi:hypothetical protein HK414_07790 [Ramlibacter terrae]|uniref:Uncharacterized protein n=1 Tax=Ramlibacter terrae TaxID=2732511 RepID=A0ABX6P1G5_9BURK|nr:hypothetical protein HK414_07790 [Ramlibacter terrae]
MMLKTSILAAAMCIGCGAGFAQSAGGVVHAVAPAEAAPRSAEDQKRFAEALRLYRGGRWAAAYDRFVALADAGDAPSSRIALQMLRHGPELYGSRWTAAPAQVLAGSAPPPATGP